MTFVLHRASGADALADALASVLADPPDDPFTPEVVAVHARGIERWLAHRLAERLGAATGRADGVCANLRFPFPGRLVGDALAAATGVEPATDPWRPERLAWPLLDVVDAHLHEPWLAVLAAHLGADPDAARRDRRFAVVRQVADLFDRYAVHRPAMLAAWHDGDDVAADGAPLAADARWQAELWRRVRAAVAVPSPPERLAAGCAALAADASLVDLPARVTLFGITRLPTSYLDVLDALAVGRDVHLFTPVAAPGVAAPAHPLLRSWGRDSRELQALLADRATHVVDHPATTPSPEPAAATGSGAPSLLARLQHAIRADLAPPRPADRPVFDPGDRSVQVHACHGRTRQAEVVRDAVLHLLAADPTLEPRDVLILCPDIDEMAPLLRAAFDGDAPADPLGAGTGHAVGHPTVPFRLADRSLRQTNPVLAAVSHLLDLADARLTASQVQAFAALGPVRHRFRFTDDDLERIAGWVRASGIRWGLDAAHRAPYDLDTVDAGTWRAGLTRLLLGVVAEEDVALVGGALPLDDVESTEIDLAGRLAELVERLAGVVADLAGPHPLDAWVAAIQRAADLLLGTRPADAWQRAQLDRLLADVEATSAGRTVPLRLAELRDLLVDRLRGQPSRAAFRTGDLTMCTLVPMRSVPHRVVCLVGIDDGAFPRAGVAHGDDLLARGRLPGDHDRRSEDRQLLLDAVLAAGDALVVTYTGRDERTNEPLPPAVVVNELLDCLDATVRIGHPPGGEPRSAGVEVGGVRRHVVVHHPLQAADVRSVEPGRLGVDGPWTFAPHLAAGARAALGPRRPTRRGWHGGRLAPVPVGTVALDHVARFVAHPVRGFLHQRLDLRGPYDDERPDDRLPVEGDALHRWAVRDRVFAALRRGAPLDAVVAAERARGTLPPGALGAGMLEAAAQEASQLASCWADLAAGGEHAVDVDLWVPADPSASAPGAPRWRVVGVVPGAHPGRATVAVAAAARIKPARKLELWVHHVAVTAARPDVAWRTVALGWQRGPVVFELEPLGADAAERAARAAHALSVLVDLRARGLREPLPLPVATAWAYAAARRAGDDLDQASMTAADTWKGGSRGYDREDEEPPHLVALGGRVPFGVLAAEPAAADEAGPGWPDDEPTRFGRLARRLCDPVLAAGRQRDAAAHPEARS